MSKKKNSNVSTYILMLVFIAGLSLLLYPGVSNFWNSLHQSQAIADYSKDVANLTAEEYARVVKEARNYNATTIFEEVHIMTAEERLNYESQLNVGNNGVMGQIEIPTIGVSLPIYHGTDPSVLQIAVGHLDWTSLPVGGIGTHCVLSGHRGLPSAKLFTNLDKLSEGDVFVLRVLNEVLTYEVDQILIVKPEDISALLREPGKDYCTLVTCTPYGINTHRLLVRGHRIENTHNSTSIHITTEAIQIEPVVIAAFVGIPSLVLMIILSFITSGAGEKTPSEEEKKRLMYGIAKEKAQDKKGAPTSEPDDEEDEDD